MEEPTGIADSPIVAMKNWDDEKQKWLGVICQVRRDENGKEFIQIYDVKSADTQVEIDDWARNSIATEPWNKAGPQ
jgi:hypothetical protein